MGRAISPAPGTFKSVQRGVINIATAATTATATIASVDAAKSELRFLGSSTDNNAVTQLAHLTLTNATTVTATRGISTSNSYASFEVVEYF